MEKKGDTFDDVSYDVDINNLKAPLKKGDIVGKLNIKGNGKVVRTVPLTINKNVLKINLFELFLRNVKDIIIGNININ